MIAIALKNQRGRFRDGLRTGKRNGSRVMTALTRKSHHTNMLGSVGMILTLTRCPLLKVTILSRGWSLDVDEEGESEAWWIKLLPELIAKTVQDPDMNVDIALRKCHGGDGSNGNGSNGKHKRDQDIWNSHLMRVIEWTIWMKKCLLLGANQGMWVCDQWWVQWLMVGLDGSSFLNLADNFLFWTQCTFFVVVIATSLQLDHSASRNGVTILGVFCITVTLQFLWSGGVMAWLCGLQKECHNLGQFPWQPQSARSNWVWRRGEDNKEWDCDMHCLLRCPFENIPIAVQNVQDFWRRSPRSECFWFHVNCSTWIHLDLIDMLSLGSWVHSFTTLGVLSNWVATGCGQISSSNILLCPQLQSSLADVAQWCKVIVHRWSPFQCVLHFKQLLQVEFSKLWPPPDCGFFFMMPIAILSQKILGIHLQRCHLHNDLQGLVPEQDGIDSNFLQGKFWNLGMKKHLLVEVCPHSSQLGQSMQEEAKLKINLVTKNITEFICDNKKLTSDNNTTFLCQSSIFECWRPLLIFSHYRKSSWRPLGSKTDSLHF